MTVFVAFCEGMVKNAVCLLRSGGCVAVFLG